MNIYYCREGEKPVNSAVASLRFERSDGESNATIYIDHVPVAYLSSYGTLNLLPMEVGDGFRGGGDIKDVEYLESKGILLDRKPHRWNKQGFWEYYIKVED
tara:strand:+ start:29931 stop:30233 length:303 start_codon:yes stop_codon:yes gene_type:complete